MKKIAFLFVFSVFAVLMTNAQVTKETQIDGPRPACIFIQCTGEVVCGEIFIINTFWKIPTFPGPIKHNAKIKGVFTGEDGEYTFQRVVHDRNWGVPNLVGADRATSTWTAHLQLNGKPFAIMHGTNHMTKNPDGEVITEFRKMIVKCH